MRRILIAAPVALMACGPVALAQSASQPDSQATMSPSGSRAANGAAPANGVIAPRTPGGISAGAVQNNQGRMNTTVGGINDHLLNQEKDRPTLPGQAPSPSQTLPGGTASGQTPHSH